MDDNEIAILGKYIREVSLKRKDFLLTQGQTCREVYFVEKGCLRMYFITRKLTEQITQFAIDGWWISDYFSFRNKTNTDYYIQCIEKSKILSIDVNQFDQLLKELPQLERYFRIIMQRAVEAYQHRSKLMYEMSKEEFYQHFSNSFPEFMQRVPQYMIASYLGLTPEYVSELRRKKL